MNPADVTAVALSIDGGGSTDDWDIAGVNVQLVSLTANGTPAACLVDLSGANSCDTQEASCQGGQLSDGNSGIVRLGPDGQGSMVIFNMATVTNPTPPSWGGCAPWQGPVPTNPLDTLRFVISTSDDDLDSGSELDFDILGYNPDGSTNTTTPIESGIVHKAGDADFEDQTQQTVDVALNDNDRCTFCTPVSYESIAAIRLRFTANQNCILDICSSDKWDVEDIIVNGVNSNTAPYETVCIADGPEGNETYSTTCFAPCIEDEVDFSTSTSSLVIPKTIGGCR